ncbi:NAD kinase [Bacillus sp. HMF5848]|uniref:NAD kinase n=1 Tax=Bacillus sp. HMF5848 TaxID=2495421 RepID=UPI000F7A31DF|nr:NAD kinase [Bacillus sp. HMF5848]RSK28178.1 NAD kinase [Bacillus sp. HMF5848]
MPQRNNIYFFYKKEPELTSRVDKLIEAARNINYNVVEDASEANIICSIGGDGTFLQAVRKTGFRDDCLYAGISALDRLSFYCDFKLDDISSIINAMDNEEVEVRRYPTIEVTIDDHASFLCLNECSVRSGIIKTFVMDVYIDDFHFETFRGDGMLVSTPTGSTAYNKSVDGAIVDPLLSCMQVSEIASLNNNHYRTLGSSFLLSGDRRLTLKVVQDGNDYPTIGIDNEALSIRHIHDLHIRLSDRKIKTIKLKDNSFWHKVQRTFL